MFVEETNGLSLPGQHLKLLSLPLEAAAKGVKLCLPCGAGGGFMISLTQAFSNLALLTFGAGELVWAVLCLVGCSAASLVSVAEMPVAPPLAVVATKDVCRDIVKCLLGDGTARG